MAAEQPDGSIVTPDPGRTGPDDVPEGEATDWTPYIVLAFILVCFFTGLLLLSLSVYLG